MRNREDYIPEEIKNYSRMMQSKPYHKMMTQKVLFSGQLFQKNEV